MPSAHLWIEAKLDAEWQPDQVKRYTEAQADLEGEDKAVLCLVRYAPPFQARYTRWMRVAELCDGHGRRWGGPTWRDDALDGDAPARVRMLAELLWFLEEKGDAVAGEFDEGVWKAFASVDRVLAGVDAPLTAAAQQSRPCRLRRRRPRLRRGAFRLSASSPWHLALGLQPRGCRGGGVRGTAFTMERPARVRDSVDRLRRGVHRRRDR